MQRVNCPVLLPGYYLYIEASAPRQPGDLARITTPSFQNTATGSFCLSFWYHMYGNNIGSLNVYLQDGGSKTNVFTRTGNQVNFWLYRSVTVNPSSPQFSVSFQFYLCAHFDLC
ncbi:hypothetical protein DPMN_011733 [Dreissena polymorpha]|uniref:MAM domain-containing protein n=1 Tax=Dreissena polymorpha TaxID=45954 RepID=A0A9D4S0B5_DREPO|nr:hypothetical protein DPMN_011733 [Dreissena polymorpha]